MAKYRLLFSSATHLQAEDRPEWDEKEIVASRFCFPPSDIHIDGSGADWIDFMVWFSFEASSPAEIRSETERIAQTCGRDVEVFSVLDEKDNVVLTEEELWT
jgi:hypothetical protein